MGFEQDKAIIRDLALRYAQVADDPVQLERKQRMRDTNDLKIVRPVILIDEIPWHEMNTDEELTLRCEGEEARAVEQYLRRNLYRAKHFPVDTIFERLYPISKAFDDTGYGLEVQENARHTDDRNNIYSHQYIDQLPDEAALEKIQLPVITPRPEVDQRRVEEAEELLDGILPVVLRGQIIYCAPWDRIARYRGVEPILIDMVDRPDFIHKLMARFTQCDQARFDQYERYHLFDATAPTLHCTPAYVTGVPESGNPNGPFRYQDMWFRTMAQMFSTVSPQMHWEFDIEHTLPMMKKCAYTYYGCCEPLDRKLDILKRIPNLRKIGATPWADTERIAEQTAGKYVLASKPNPANVAIKTDYDVVYQEICKTLELCVKYHCPVEFVIKDISTVGYHPENLEIWAKAATDAVNRYFG